MKSNINTKNNQFALPLLINPCPDTGYIPVLAYNNTFEAVALAKMDEYGSYLSLCDYTTTNEDDITFMIKKWNESTLNRRWNDVAIDKHLFYHLNYLLVDEDTSAILQSYPSLNDAKKAKDIYENRFGKKCKIYMMYDNIVHVCLYRTPKTNN